MMWILQGISEKPLEFIQYLVHTLLICKLLLIPNDHVQCISVKQSDRKELSYSVKEESEVGSFVGNLKLDAERKFLIPSTQLSHFELYDNSENGHFRVEPESGKLFVASRIDREKICPQPNAVADRDTVNTDNSWVGPFTNRVNGAAAAAEECQVHLAMYVGQKYWMNIIITIIDINDHEPYFPLSDTGMKLPLYIINVSEAVAVGYEVPLTAAKDADVGLNSVQSYSLRGPELDPNLFSISYKPPFALNLVILGELDAEKKSNYTGELVACDGGQPMPKCGVQPLLIHVTDLNDNKPVFGQSTYEVEVNENIALNSTVIVLDATDADSGPRGKIHYRFGQPISQAVLQHFGLDEESGKIYTKKPLNARENPRFTVPVIAEDEGVLPLVGQALVRISVRDTNDHKPWIEIRPVQSSSQQDTEHRDGDSLTVKENRPAGTNIGLVIAGDEDVGENSAVTCRLQQDNNEFSLEHANSAKGREMYRLSTNRSFNRESLASGLIVLRIVCTDMGKPRMSTEKTVSVLIQDVNEFPPLFTAGRQAYEVHLEEGREAGTFVIQIQASDSDVTPKIRYRLSREAESFFHIDPTSGNITTRVVLDREEMPVVRFSVFATDADQAEMDALTNAAVTNVTVFVDDVNDNTPQLTENRALQVVENRPGFSDLVGQLTAIDKDAGHNGTVIYKLSSVTSDGRSILNDTFMINRESGKIYTLRTLDREEHSQYQLNVELQDLGKPPRNASQIVLVNVLDENDNAPAWDEPIIAVSEAEYSTTHSLFTHAPRMPGLGKLHEFGLLNATVPLYRGQRLLKLLADDPDASHNANLTFSLLGTYYSAQGTEAISSSFDGSSRRQMFSAVHNFFNLLAETGELIVGPGPKGTGIRDPGLLELYFRVSDNGSPPLQATARLFIRLRSSESIEDTGYFSPKDLINYILSSGYLGITLIVILVLIICLTSVCLVIAFNSLRQRSRGCCTCCCPRRRRKGFPKLRGERLQMESQQGAENGLILDGQLSALGRIYGTPKQSSLISDGGSLYKWVPDAKFSFGNFGPPPIYNFPVLSATLDRMREGQTGSEKSGVALLSLDSTYSGNLPFDDQAMRAEQVSVSPFHSIIQTTQRDGSILLPSYSTCEADQSATMLIRNPKTDGMTSKLSHLRAFTSEVDGGSADSGQGASEEEPLVLDGWKREPCCRSLNPPTVASPVTVTPSTVTTFTSGVQQAEVHQSASPSTAPSPACILPPPPTNIDNAQPRWQKPLFAHAEFGHHNQLFDDYPINRDQHVRQSATLPISSRNIPSIDSEKEFARYTPTPDRAKKVSTLTSMHSRNWDG
ncbi:unnamed protein product [Calicophoron daubneyi]|uniref:Cadherin domain-containing protein n=1 Tax=Calicophoron daubneyi TaxID=300641 RepID=A0AAV2T1P5_CALDB